MNNEEYNSKMIDDYIKANCIGEDGIIRVTEDDFFNMLLKYATPELPEESNDELKPNEYKCAMCGNIYETGWSYEEAWEESKSNFGELPDYDVAIICDHCYNKSVKPTFS